jgi:hypothetical protein
MKCPLNVPTCEMLDGEICSVFCAAVARPAIELKLLLARADAMEAEQAQLRKMNGRAFGEMVLNGKKT